MKCWSAESSDDHPCHQYPCHSDGPVFGPEESRGCSCFLLCPFWTPRSPHFFLGNSPFVCYSLFRLAATGSSRLRHLAFLGVWPFRPLGDPMKALGDPVEISG